jgi:lambda repressor-like predicted transcriptional regulator
VIGTAQSAVQEALSALGVVQYDLRSREETDPGNPAAVVTRGAVRTPGGGSYYFVHREDSAPLLIKADSPERAAEADRIWKALEPETEGPVIQSTTPDLPERGKKWHEEEKKDEEDEDKDADPVARLKKATETLRRLSGEASMHKAQLPNYTRRFLEHLGYTAEDIDAGRVTLQPDQRPAALRWMAKSLRASVDALREIAGEDDA